MSLARDVVPRPVYMYHVTFPSKRERVDVVLDRFDMVYHGFWITHVDALCHVGWDGELYNGRPFTDEPHRRGRDLVPDRPDLRRTASPPAASSSTSRPAPEGYVTVGQPGDAAGAGRGGARAPA